MAPMARAIRRKLRPGAPGFGRASSDPGSTSSARSAASAVRETPFERNRECIATSLGCDRATGVPAPTWGRGAPCGSEVDREAEPHAARSPVEVVQASEGEVFGIRRPALLIDREDVVAVAEALFRPDPVDAVRGLGLAV